jgi:hypothetical protein
MTGKRDPDRAPEQALHAALSNLSQVYEDALAAVRRISDPQRAVAAATELATLLRTKSEDASEVRNALAYRIWKAEELSLSVLAQRIGVSKARADQIIKAAKANEEEQ